MWSVPRERELGETLCPDREPILASRAREADDRAHVHLIGAPRRKGRRFGCLFCNLLLELIAWLYAHRRNPALFTEVATPLHFFGYRLPTYTFTL